MAIPINTASSSASNQVQNLKVTDVTVTDVEAVDVPSRSTNPVFPANQAEETEISREALEANVSRINDFVQNIQRSIRFSVAEASGRTIIEVYDKETDELIREIPSEAVQRISEAIAEQINEGLLLAIDV